MKSIKVGWLKVLCFILLVGCSNEDQTVKRAYPSIDTEDVTGISSDGAILNGTILNIGTSRVLDHGFVYDYAENPSLENSDRISLGEIAAAGPFSVIVNRNLVKDKKYYVRAFAITQQNSIVVYGQRVEFISMGGRAPEIHDFINHEGSIGDTVLIVGTGFSNIVANNKAFFNSAVAHIYKSLIDSLWCTVPMYTNEGVSTLTVQVGQDKTQAEQKFALKPLSVISFDPMTASFGDTILIQGLNFPTNSNLVKVTLLGFDVVVISISSSMLKVIIPNEAAIAESTVSVMAGIQTKVLPNKIKLLPPVLTSFSPVKATNDTEIKIAGKYFSPVIAHNKVVIDNNVIDVTACTKTGITIKIPSGITPGKYPISITVAGQLVTSIDQIEIIQP